MQRIIKIDGDDYCISENKEMDVNIITRLYPNEDGLLVLHKYFDFVQGCNMTADEIKQYIHRENLARFIEKDFQGTIL